MSFDLLGSKSPAYICVKLEYTFKMHYYFITRCVLTPQTVATMLLHVTCALLK